MFRSACTEKIFVQRSEREIFIAFWIIVILAWFIDQLFSCASSVLVNWIPKQIFLLLSPPHLFLYGNIFSVVSVYEWPIFRPIPHCMLIAHWDDLCRKGQTSELFGCLNGEPLVEICVRFFSVIFLGWECCLTLKQLSSTYSCHARLNTIETGGDFQLQSETMPVRPQSNQSLHFDGAINKSVHLWQICWGLFVCKPDPGLFILLSLPFDISKRKEPFCGSVWSLW